MNTYTIMQNKNKYSVSMRNIIIFFISIICSGIVMYYNTREIYDLLFILPIIYGFCYLIVLSTTIHGNISYHIRHFQWGVP